MPMRPPRRTPPDAGLGTEAMRAHRIEERGRRVRRADPGGVRARARRSGIRASVITGVFFPLLCSLPAAAQAVRGRVLEEGTASPVIGAHVILIDGAGKPSFSTLTSDQGVFTLQVPGAGRYHVRVEMIGRRTVDSRVFVVGVDDVSNIAVAMPREPVRLAGLDVRASSKCEVRPSSGVPTQTVWDEARKALSVEAAVREQRLYRFDITRYSREMDANGRRVVNEDAKYVSRFSGDPFVSRPAEQLAAEGYAEPSGEDFTFYGPSGTVLLSDPFLDTHCFFLRRDRDHEGEIGLAFEPIKGRRLTDVEGVLWLNEQTAELRSLEFTYMNTPSQLPPAKRGGDARFQRLPNGAFIVREWNIRSPVFQRTESMFGSQRVSGERIVAYYVDGGEVINIIDRSGNVVDASPRAVVAGIVYDSTAGGPLDSAVVTLIGTNYAGRTDAQGRFRIANLPPGIYAVGFRHSRTDSWRWTPEPVEVELERGAVTEVVLAIPRAGPPLVMITDAARRDSIAELGRVFGHPEWAYLLMPAATPPAVDIDTTAASGRMRGRVLTEVGEPVAGARVAIDSTRWTTESGDDGRFRFDAMRPGVHTMVVTAPGFRRNETRVALHPGQYLDAEIRLTRLDPDRPPPAAPDPATRPASMPASGHGIAAASRNASEPTLPPMTAPPTARPSTLHGRVIDIDDGKAIRGVAITVGGTTRTVTTSDAGRFVLDGLHAGNIELDARVIGYGERTVTIRLDGGLTADVEIQLAKKPIELPPIDVEVRSEKLADVGFYARREEGFGGYRFTRADIERFNPRALTDLVERIPVALVRYGEPGRRVIHFRRWPGAVESITRNGEYGCIPDIYLDGAPLGQRGDAGNLYTPRLPDYNVVSPDAIEGIEMYVGAAGTPIQYSSPCGVVLIWTRR